MMPALAPRDRILGEILGADAGAYARLALTDLTLDSREVIPGAAFVALQGAREHGLRYAADALARGAAIVLYEPSEVYADPPMPSLAVPNLHKRLGELAHAFFDTLPEPTLIGVTGTNGKTTVAYLTAQALGPQRGARTSARSATACRRSSRATRSRRPIASRCTARSRGCVRRASRSRFPRTRSRRTGSRASPSTPQCSRISRATTSTSTATLRATAARRRACSSCRVSRTRSSTSTTPFGAGLGANLPASCDLIRTTIRGVRGADLSARLKRADLDGLTLEVSGRFGSGAARVAANRRLQCREPARRARRAARAGHAVADACSALGEAQPAPGRMEVLGRSRQLAVGRDRLRAYARRAAPRAEHADRARPAPNRLRVRLRRRPRPRQAAADGRRGGGARGHASCSPTTTRATRIPPTSCATSAAASATTPTSA